MINMLQLFIRACIKCGLVGPKTQSPNPCELCEGPCVPPEGETIPFSIAKKGLANGSCPTLCLGFRVGCSTIP